MCLLVLWKLIENLIRNYFGLYNLVLLKLSSLKIMKFDTIKDKQTTSFS